MSVLSCATCVLYWFKVPPSGFNHRDCLPRPAIHFPGCGRDEPDSVWEDESVGSSSNAYAQKYFNMSGRWSFLQPTPLQPRPSRRPWRLLGERRSDKQTNAATNRKLRRTMERHRQSRRRAHRTGLHGFHPWLRPGAQGVELRGPPGAGPRTHRFSDARRVDRWRLYHHLRHRQFP